VCNEGGEYETFVVNCPLWSKGIVTYDLCPGSYGRDSLETIESSGDVAYLQIAAHTDEKPPLSEPWRSFPQSLLENKFREIYTKTKDTPRFQPSEGDVLDYALPDPPRLVEIGPGVYATNTIPTPTPCHPLSKS
jgi:hypothetical protein